MRRYGKVVEKVQKLLDLMTGLRKVRENIPRKETVAAVFQQRRELVCLLKLRRKNCADCSLGCTDILRVRVPLRLRTCL